VGTQCDGDGLMLEVRPKKSNWLLIALFLISAVFLVGFFAQQAYVYKDIKIYKTAFELEAEYAERGLRRSQLYVADAYARGFQVEASEEKARFWYAKAAANNAPIGQYEYGKRLLEGRGGPKDEAEGYRQVFRAALAEYAPAEYLVSDLLCEGRVVAKDCEQGIYYLEKAATQYEPLAMNRLANRYETGDGVTRSITNAYLWYGVAYDVRTKGKMAEFPPDPNILRLEAQLNPDEKAKALILIKEKSPKRDSRTYKARWF